MLFQVYIGLDRYVGREVWESCLFSKDPSKFLRTCARLVWSGKLINRSVAPIESVQDKLIRRGLPRKEIEEDREALLRRKEQIFFLFFKFIVAEKPSFLSPKFFLENTQFLKFYLKFFLFCRNVYNRSQ